jgi:hypothetical protein
VLNNLVRGRATPCYCFGHSEIISLRTLMRLFLLLFGEAFLLLDPELFASGSTRYYLRITGIDEYGVLFVWVILLLLGALWCLSVREIVLLVQGPRESSVNRVA